MTHPDIYDFFTDRFTEIPFDDESSVRGPSSPDGFTAFFSIDPPGDEPPGGGSEETCVPDEEEGGWICRSEDGMIYKIIAEQVPDDDDGGLPICVEDPANGIFCA